MQFQKFPNSDLKLPVIQILVLEIMTPLRWQVKVFDMVKGRKSLTD